MQIAKVRGTIVSTHKTRSLTGIKFLLVQYINPEGEMMPKYEVAGDTVGAGLNEWVLVSRGGAARVENGHTERPLDAMVVGIIDTINVDNRLLYSKKNEDRSHREKLPGSSQ